LSINNLRAERLREIENPGDAAAGLVKNVLRSRSLETISTMARTDFVQRSPLTRDALAFADQRHAGQTRDLDDLPFVTHPVEVACLLHDAGYQDEVVAAGVLHDVLEDTDAERSDLESRFGPRVAELVEAVTDDPTIEDDAERRAALRRQVADAGEFAAVVFAADKVSKARELRVRVSRGRFRRADCGKFAHYEASLEMLSDLIPGHELVDQLRMEVEALQALPAGGV
jgi:(p)ppGpp synthase/HD superfamily hydrolase